MAERLNYTDSMLNNNSKYFPAQSSKWQPQVTMGDSHESADTETLVFRCEVFSAKSINYEVVHLTSLFWSYEARAE